MKHSKSSASFSGKCVDTHKAIEVNINREKHEGRQERHFRCSGYPSLPLKRGHNNIVNNIKMKINKICIRISFKMICKCLTIITLVPLLILVFLLCTGQIKNLHRYVAVALRRAYDSRDFPILRYFL